MERIRKAAYDDLELPNGADRDSIRTSYKRLAHKWHPDKHNNAPQALLKFHDISLAYHRLEANTDTIDITMPEMLNLYERIFFPSQALSNGYGLSDDDDDDDDFDDSDDEYTRREPYGRKLTAEEIERNATELITEEEKDKRRAEKRRAKKKRRREKKRLEKQNKTDTRSNESSKEAMPSKNIRHNSSGSEAEGFDTNAAFFTQVKNKKKKPVLATESAQKTVTNKQNNTVEDGTEVLDAVVVHSRQLAIRGNELANNGHYQAAIDLFTKAIELVSTDHRFFGNRSYCFDRTQQYDKALKDAERAITLSTEWPKGYFRKGRALGGLKLYADAEQAFLQVLKLDENCEDAVQELVRVRTFQLTEMGFSTQQAEHAIEQYSSVQQALDALLSGLSADSCKLSDSSLAGEVYVSDEDDYTSPALTTRTYSTPTQQSPTLNFTPATSNKVADSKMDANNPDGLTALWVGNVLPDVSQVQLQQIFAKWGTVTSIRMLPEKYCAFVNFKTKEGAGRAMEHVQGFECAGQHLLVKFPDNPLSNGNVVIRKGTPAAATQTKSSNRSPSADPPMPVSRTVHGDECYFWRTTGCIFGDRCTNKHVPKHKGIDRKPWHNM